MFEYRTQYPLPSKTSLTPDCPILRNLCYHKPRLFLTFCLTTFSYSSLLFLHIFAASIFAGLSSFGSASMLITLMRIFSTLCIGDQRSDACSY